MNKDTVYPNMLNGCRSMTYTKKDYIKRLEFARDNGCNTVMLTGDFRTTTKRNFLQRFGTMNASLPSPFWVDRITDNRDYA